MSSFSIKNYRITCNIEMFSRAIFSIRRLMVAIFPPHNIVFQDSVGQIKPKTTTSNPTKPDSLAASHPRKLNFMTRRVLPPSPYPSYVGSFSFLFFSTSFHRTEKDEASVANPENSRRRKKSIQKRTSAFIKWTGTLN